MSKSTFSKLMGVWTTGGFITVEALKGMVFSNQYQNSFYTPSLRRDIQTLVRSRLGHYMTYRFWDWFIQSGITNQNIETLPVFCTYYRGLISLQITSPDFKVSEPMAPETYLGYS